jgi:Bifunctional DNA primase/polymerase, N-terminal
MTTDADAPQSELLEWPDDWPLVPCNWDKEPYVRWKHLQKEGARTPPEQLQEWQDRFNPPCWAVVCGPGRCVVLDFEPEGMYLVAAWGLNPHVETPSGGAHVYVAHPGWYVKTFNTRSQSPWHVHYPHLDVRANGGIAVVGGQSRRGRYKRLRPLVPDPLEVLPEEVRAKLGLLQPPLKTPPEDDTEEDLHEPEPWDGDPAERYPADRLLQQALTKVREGEHRNDTGFWLMQQLRDNDYSREEADEIGRRFVAAVPAKDHPYTVCEMGASLRSAYDGEKRSPSGGAVTIEEVTDDQGRVTRRYILPDGRLMMTLGPLRLGNGDPGGRNGQAEPNDAQEMQGQPPRRMFLITFEELDARPLVPRRCLIAPHLGAGEAHLLFARRATSSRSRPWNGRSLWRSGGPCMGSSPPSRGWCSAWTWKTAWTACASACGPTSRAMA